MEWSAGQWFVGGIIAIWTTVFVVGCVWLGVVAVRERLRGTMSEKKAVNGNGTKLTINLVNRLFWMMLVSTGLAVAVDIANVFTHYVIPNQSIWGVAQMMIGAFLSLIDPSAVKERILHGVEKRIEESGSHSG